MDISEHMSKTDAAIALLARGRLKHLPFVLLRDDPGTAGTMSMVYCAGGEFLDQALDALLGQIEMADVDDGVKARMLLDARVKCAQVLRRIKSVDLDNELSAGEI